MNNIPVAPWRLQTMAALFVLLFAALLWRVLSLQVLDTDRGYAFLQGQGEARYVRTAELPAWRGNIVDRRGEVLAASTPVISLWANPPVLAQSERIDELAAALDIRPAQLRQRLQRYADKAFVYLKRQMTPGAARRVLRLQIAGVSGQREYQRYYPAGEVTVHLLGITDVDDRGIEGLELAYDGRLSGLPGRKQVIKDRYGGVVRDVGELEPARPGRSLQLSIDLRLQYLAHKELQRAVALSGARAGSVVTLDSRTGEVLALVNHPTYNPNRRGAVVPGHSRNRALTDMFEPGSTMKPLTLVAAFESGLFTPDTLIDTAPGRVRVGARTLLDPVNYGAISVARVLEKSSQVGIVKIALQLEEHSVWRTFNRFGLGQNPGTVFPGESAGIMPYREHRRPIERVTLAYGYGLAVTPLQLARAYAVIASGGRLLLPSLTRLEATAVSAPQVVAPGVADSVLNIMRGATRPTGTARRARVEGYSVAGKTGTAHKASSNGYADDRYLAYFAGIAPASAPRLVTIVLIDEPKGDHYYGGEVAAPVFSRITAAALRLLNVVPDRLAEADA